MDGTSGITQCHVDPNGTAVYRFTPDMRARFGGIATRLRKDIAEAISIQLGDAQEGPTIWDSIVINNRGRYNYTVTASHGFTDCTDHQPLPKIHFEADSKYLLRLINMATLAPIVFSADDRKIQVVVADSKYFQPTELINSITINADQRYDFLAQATKSSSANQIGSF
ncbi:hypothetical protein PC129_g9203 [Phytophthora cactorum]|uniref:Plastocyanin-like domain-containing protein n=2 Tax=Phytophthora cactorum TaxID=29920 RepID=A0A8T1I6T6_9STRA|nr:hypothetical protein PC129_g9203 [Phytophthora cactorum]